MLIDTDTALTYLHDYLTGNKARGMVAELALTEIVPAETLQNKLLTGAWIIAPKGSPQHRVAIFVLPSIYETRNHLLQAAHARQRDRAWQALATYLHQNRIGVVVSAATLKGKDWNQFEALSWVNLIYQNESLQMASEDAPFSAWPGNRGYARKTPQDSRWPEDVLLRFKNASRDDLSALTLRQAFYYSYLKNTLKKPLEDPYDVDAFIVSYRGAVLPIEIKEKSQTKNGQFGVDAGRILMLLRMCILTDSNAFYLIREIDNSPERRFLAWRYISLADLILNCRWNLQGGGRGMGGGSTQTIMMSSDLFADFGSQQLQEDWLATNGRLKQALITSAQALEHDLQRYLSR